MMDVQTLLFYIFSTILLVSAFRVITARNPVHAVLFLVLAFFQASMIWMLLKVEFLALSLVLVYVGAVMVLFLFVVMMLDVKLNSIRNDFWKHFPLAAVVGVLIIFEMSAVLMGGFRVVDEPSSVTAVGLVVNEISNTRELGILLYTHYLYPLEVAAAILLLAMIAAIALTLRQRKDVKALDPGTQVRVKAADRMNVIKMASTLPYVVAEDVDLVSKENKA